MRVSACIIRTLKKLQFILSDYFFLTFVFRSYLKYCWCIRVWVIENPPLIGVVSLNFNVWIWLSVFFLPLSHKTFNSRYCFNICTPFVTPINKFVIILYMCVVCFLLWYDRICCLLETCLKKKKKKVYHSSRTWFDLPITNIILARLYVVDVDDVDLVSLPSV